MRNFLALTLLTMAFWPKAALHAASFDYYLLSLTWAPEYCHAHPQDKTPECNAQGKMSFVVHGLWPSNTSGSDPAGCPATAFDRSAVPRDLSQIMPSNLFSHEWRTHGVCSGMTESVYFQKIASLYSSLAVPVKATGQDQQVSPATLRQEFAQANAGTTPQSFAVEDNGRYLTEVRICWDRSFRAMACPKQGDTRNSPITIRGKP